MNDKAARKRLARGLFIAIALLIVTFDYVWNQPHAALVAAWLVMALVPLLAVAYQCALGFVRALGSPKADGSLDTVFWIVFLAVPSVLWGVYWVCSYLRYLLTGHML
ncbi:hypothetical protein ACFFTN_20450 [Aminobacter aganoensis]|uniref:Uncharacterized protein n=1 Tax=Aminobacter aganoensis TaxID=83264 RepID=A0A7X0CC23_9HYPH|nr:hypothetical protein [Aminobacter aganoensis]MBB6352377.1 hypothetical protein [Aminobacter aganoensis]